MTLDLSRYHLEDDIKIGDIISIQLISNAKGVALYAGTLETSYENQPHPFETVLNGISIVGETQLIPNKIVIPQQLPAYSATDVALLSSGEYVVARSMFAGAWNELEVGTVEDEGIQKVFDYQIEETNLPHFVLESSGNPLSEPTVSAIVSGNRLCLIGLDDQNGQKVPHVTSIVGSSSDPVSSGRIWGDFSGKLPNVINALYMNPNMVGPLSPSGAFCGTLKFGEYLIKEMRFAQKVLHIWGGIEISEFDCAISGDFLCVFAISGDGSPIIGRFTTKGEQVDQPQMPVGSWNNAENWIKSPTIIADPANKGSFYFAFIEIQNQTPSALYTGKIDASS